MKRRDFMITSTLVVSSSFVGCLSNANDTPSTTASNDDESYFEIRFKKQESDTSASTREQVSITNVSDEKRSISHFSLRYSSGYEYSFSGGLTLEPGSIVAVVSQGTRDSVAESDPPTYYRDADLPELVLADGEETVRLLNQNNELLKTATYRRD